VTKFCVCVELVGAYLDLETDKMRYDFHFVLRLSSQARDRYKFTSHTAHESFPLVFFLTLEIYIPCGSSGVTQVFFHWKKSFNSSQSTFSGHVCV